VESDNISFTHESRLAPGHVYGVLYGEQSIIMQRRAGECGECGEDYLSSVIREEEHERWGGKSNLGLLGSLAAAAKSSFFADHIPHQACWHPWSGTRTIQETDSWVGYGKSSSLGKGRCTTDFSAPYY